ncbi:hypothetical protein [Nesterenkonia aerolata]|uniref:Uncharacterized protein n=1 Tax=Nesterenkonia aerolata TaxID=3074079 RepID=A0ABU2DVR5_9MICC|nr:hypothetical protein [Nesterenkonia sp. LY-0111]MDR8020486.1 hypothetical protein [Nesterenkonia sp. LY-0111]
MAEWQGPTLEESISGARPLFLIHRSHQNANRLPETINYLADSHGDDLALGAVARLPKMTVNTMKTFAQAVSHVPVRIVDPELWRHPGSGWPGAKDLKSPANEWAYLTKQPEKPVRTWAKAVLDVQRESNASVLLSATGWVSSVEGQHSLQRALTWADASRQDAGSSPLWVNLTLDYSWLTDKRLRNALIEEIVESNEQHWYLRFWWPEVPTRYGQLQDESVLEGYRILARECDVE